MSTARADLRSTISADTTQFAAGMRRAGMIAKNTGSAIGKGLAGAVNSIGKLGAAALKSSAAIAAIGGGIVVGAFASGIKGASDFAGALSDASAQTGIAAGRMAVLQKAFADNGLAAENAAPVISKMQKFIRDLGAGTPAAVKAFDTLGITLAELQSLSPDKQLELIGQRIMAIQDPAKRAGVAIDIFGRSGAKLITLFGDGGAMTNAEGFLGTAAEILNRRAGDFDAISDKLAGIPAKLQTFFVGFLEPISGTLNSILDRFNAYDFAALGVKLGESLATGIDMVKGAMDALSIGELFEFAGLKLQSAFTDAVNILARGVAAIIELFKSGEMGSAFEKITLQFREGLLLAAADMVEALRPMFPKDRIDNAVAYLTKSADLARAQIEALEEQNKTAPPIFDSFKKEFAKASDALKMPEGDQQKMENLAARIEEAAEKYTTARKDALEKDASEPDVFGPPAPTTAPAATTSTESPETTAAPAQSNPFEQMGPSADLRSDYAKDREKKTKSMQELAAGGFTGLAGLAQMQLDRGSQSGIGPGTNGTFAKDKERLIAKGVIPGGALQTGGIGEKRKFGQQKADAENKKNLTLAEKQAASLENIERKIEASLTVN